MHKSVLAFLKRAISPEEILGKRVLEVGSFNVNGTPRSILAPHKPIEYIGVDASPGPCVDTVCLSENLVATFGAVSFDVVVSTEMLEHVCDWRPSVINMIGVLKEGGLLCVTTRSPGFKYHGYPHDYWRFTLGDFRTIFSGMSVETLESDPQVPGVFLKARKPNGFLITDLSTLEVAKALRISRTFWPKA